MQEIRVERYSTPNPQCLPAVSPHKPEPRLAIEAKSAKIGLILLFSAIKQGQHSQVQDVFNNWKFWIYKRGKLQEEIELKVSYMQLQQSYSHRTETLNELKSYSKKYFSQLLSAISSVNYQKPLEIELSNCELSKEWLDLLIQALENNSSVTEV